MDKKSFVSALLEAPKGTSRIRTMASYEADVCLREVCGMLNGDGGFLILGMDNELHACGISADEIDSIKTDIAKWIRPLPLVYIKEEDYEQKKVILVTVMKGGLPPYSYNGRFYVCSGDRSVVPDADDLSIMMRESRKHWTSWESSVNLSASWDDLNAEIMQAVIAYGKTNRLLGEDVNTPEDLLSNLSMKDVQHVMNGAVALFAKNTSSLLPQCKVRIQVMLDGKLSDGYQDTRVITGNVFDTLESVHNYFANQLPMISSFSKNNWNRKDGYLYPMDVLDEGVTNALIHRDYSFELDEVLIYVYRDKIEIINPGAMPSGMLKGKNKILPHVSKPWNPLMAELFHIGGKMEKTGRGLGLIYDGMSSLNRKLPEWSSENGMVKLTVYCKAAKKKESPRVLEFLAFYQGRMFSKADYLDFFKHDISDTSAKTDLNYMVSEKLCRKVGAGPSTKYEIIAK